MGEFARELAGGVEDASERFSAYYGLWAAHYMRCEPGPMREMAELFLSEATARPDCPEALVAHRVCGNTCVYFGDYLAAHDHFQKTVELYDKIRDGDFANRFGQDPRAAAEIFDALALWVLGQIDDALRCADRALADAKASTHAPTISYVHYFRALLGLIRGKSEAITADSQALAEIVSRYDLPGFLAGIAVFFQGWTGWLRGEGVAGLAEMQRGIAIFRQQGMVYIVPSFEAALAEAEADAGEVAAALQRLHDALADLGRTEQHWYEAETHRIRAGILLQHDPANIAAAEQSLQAAIAIAQSQNARSFELRAALSLAKLYRPANRDVDTYNVLASAVEGFPPTQQFPELSEAQTLLAALSR